MIRRGRMQAIYLDGLKWRHATSHQAECMWKALATLVTLKTVDLRLDQSRPSMGFLLQSVFILTQIRWRFPTQIIVPVCLQNCRRSATSQSCREETGNLQDKLFVIVVSLLNQRVFSFLFSSRWISVVLPPLHRYCCMCGSSVN
jgi:hypothetical protein